MPFHMISRFHLRQALSQSQQIAWIAALGYPYFSFLALTFLLRQGSSLMSRFIGQSLAFNAKQQLISTLGIVHAIGDAIAISEIKLSKVTV